MVTDDAVLSVTDEAREYILETRAGEPDGEKLALYLEVSGEADGAYTYDMWFQQASDAGSGDEVHVWDGLTVICAAPTKFAATNICRFERLSASFAAPAPR